MLYKPYEGILLRTNMPIKQKICLLDANLGRIECFSKHKKSLLCLTAGAYITYNLQSWHMYYDIHDIILHDMPTYWARTHLAFFHHVLELCYYFLPLDQEVKEVFQLLCLLYKCPEVFSRFLEQKLFLCHFFRYLCIYPDDASYYCSSFLSLISAPLGSKVSAYVTYSEKQLQHILSKWLFSCIAIHPTAHRLKTIDFLKKLDFYE